MRIAIAALVIFSFSVPALAEEATLSGAHEIEDAYAAYFSHASIAKGVISVKPAGEAYVVTWDLQRALAIFGAKPEAAEIGPFSYKLTRDGDEGWSWSSDAFPRLTFKGDADKGPASAAFVIDGFGLEGRYYPDKEPFLTNKASFGSVKGDVTQTDDKGPTRVRFAENDLLVELLAKSNDDGGVDIVLAQSLGAVSQVVTPPGGAAGGDSDMKLNSDGSAGAGAVAGLRATEIGALWRALVAGAENGKPDEELVDLVAAALPLWKDIETEFRFKNVSVATPFGSAGLAGLAQSMKLSGLTDEGRLEIGFDFDDLKLQSSMAPAWANQLTPLSAKLGVALSDRNIGAAARMAIKDPKFGASGELSADTQAAINAAIKAGDPKMVLLPGRLKTPLVDLAFEGSAKIDPVAVSARMKVSADSLDKTLALAAELGKSNPDLQNAMLGLTLIKGLAKTGADGRLTWDVSVEGDKVTINGSPLPTGK